MTYPDLSQKVALITGGTRGIGAATAKQFAQNGTKLVLVYKSDHDQAHQTQAEIKSLGVECLLISADLSDQSQIPQIVDQTLTHFGHIDILINNAGAYLPGDEWNGPIESWQKSIDINFLANLTLSKKVSEHFLTQKSGVIVNVASRFAIKGNYEELTYGALKAALLNVTQSYAKLLSPFGRANVVSPGATLAGYWKIASSTELEKTQSKNPHGRLINPEEIASVILFLSSTVSNMINGQNILVDGGASLF